MLRSLFFLYFLIFSIDAQEEGTFCDHPIYKNAICTLVTNCSHAKILLKKNQRPIHCGFKGLLPIVCCPQIGEITDLKCDQYSERSGNVTYLGTPSEPKEFPHMAILGFEIENRTSWLCGGSLISESFILTAGHCIDTVQYGRVKWARLGDLNISTELDDAEPQTFKVKNVFIHPEYKPPSHYHDIALIELEIQANFSDYIQPACIRTTKDIFENEKLFATGWGKTDFAGDTSPHLLKIEPSIVSFNQCSKHYSTVSVKKLAEGIRDDIQICAGHPDGRDTCEGDSGGPLQIKMFGLVRNYYDIVGVTSFGKACGVIHSAGVYVRVFPYIEWIESIVWPM